ncbi:MAG: hypothetical protein LQ339_000027 [Xanthoria mediterranea]|nr:MAG: hypothetical protein LQ339_000027 [Xanthoria mediterranea]
MARDTDGERIPLLNSASSQGVALAQRVGTLLSNWWLWELIEACTSIIALAVIVVILFVYDGSSLPDWPSVFTINSVISFLSTISKLSIVAATSAAVSQCKWLWYRQTEPCRLQDLQLFDDASRGPWGAVQLLFSLRARHLAFIGAVVVVLANFFDPFVQQVVAYRSRSVPSGKAPEIVKSRVYAARSDEGLPLPSVVDLSMKAGIYNGVFDIKDNADSGISHTCSTGNCSWQDVASLAICSRCVDITSQVEKECTDGKCHLLYIPNGPTLSGLGGQINSSTTNISSELQGIEPSVLRFTSLLSKKVSDPDDALAIECSIFYCIGRYTASVKDGIVEQRLLASWRNDSARLDTKTDLILNPPTSFSNESGAEPYRVTHLAAHALNSFMSETFTGSGGINNSGSAFSSDVMQALYDASNLTGRIENLATSMTNSIRGQDDNVSGPAYGTAWTSETYVHVRWAWLAFPAALILLASCFIVGVILETSYRDILVWKSSNIALLFHGRSLRLSRRNEKPVNKLSAMTSRATNVKARLVESDAEGWKLDQDE